VKTDGGMRLELALILAACSALQFINPVFGVTAVVVLAAIAALVVVWNSAFGRRFRLRLLAVRGLPSRLCRRRRDKEPWLRWPARLRSCACIADESVTIVVMTSCTSGVCASGRALSLLKIPALAHPRHTEVHKDQQKGGSQLTDSQPIRSILITHAAG
jgi:hypothetical protein